MRNSTVWTEDEKKFLMDNWGELSIRVIARRLGRSENAITIKAERMGLSKMDYYTDCITLNKLASTMGQCSKKLLSLDVPYSYKRNTTSKVRVVYVDDEFWKWAHANRYKLNFKKFKAGELGPEPDWVDKKRVSDKKKSLHISTDPWTKSADKQLIFLLEQYKFGYSDIARMLRRTESAIKRRIHELGIKTRPVKADDHVAWTDEEVNILIDMYNVGYTFEDISLELGARTVLAVKGKIERLTLEGVIN